MKVKIFKMHLEMTFFAYFLMNTKKTYRIHYVNHIYVNRGHWHSKKKKLKKVNIWKCTCRLHFFHHFSYDSHNIYIIHFLNIKYVLPNTQILISYMTIWHYILNRPQPRDAIFCIISYEITTRLTDYIFLT